VSELRGRIRQWVTGTYKLVTALLQLLEGNIQSTLRSMQEGRRKVIQNHVLGKNEHDESAMHLSQERETGDGLGEPQSCEGEKGVSAVPFARAGQKESVRPGVPNEKELSKRYPPDPENTSQLRHKSVSCLANGRRR
jgi:hypothetical protein